MRGEENRIGGTTGGFGDRLGYLEVTYRLGTGVDRVAEEAVETLLASHVEQVALDEVHGSALRRVLAEQTAYRAWEAYFAEGGRVRTFTPPTREALRSIPPERLVLAGNGRYLPDRLLILGRAREPAMDEFLFHEIQHYVLDRWDSPLFEAGEADHQVIALIEQRRGLVESLRAGRIPLDAASGRLPGDVDGAATEAFEAGRWTEAVEHVGSEAFYRSWVRGAISRVESKNANNRQVRIVSMPLSDGRTLLFDERSDREEPAELKAMNARVPPHYRYGAVLYVSLRDLRDFDAGRLFAEGDVAERDQGRVLAFVNQHRSDWSRGRHHIFTEAQLQDLAHLSALNAALLQGALRLAVSSPSEPGTALEEAMGGAAYQAALSGFLEGLVGRLVAEPGGDPREAAVAVLDALGAVSRRQPPEPAKGPRAREPVDVTR